VTFSVLSQAATCYYRSSHSNLEAIPLKYLAQGYNKRTCRPIFTLTLLDAER